MLVIVASCAPLNQGGWRTPNQTGTMPQDTTYDDKSAQVPPKKPMNSNAFDSLPSVNVAILLPLSGAQGALGQSMLQGAQLALFEMGYTNFNLMPRDTMGTQNGAAAAATSAINDGAQLILGPLLADSVRAVKPIARSKNINIIAFSTDWTLADNNTFLMGFMPFSQVERVAKYALSKGYKDFALIAPQDAYGNAVAGQFSEVILKNGGEIASTVRFNSTDPAVIDQIANLKPAEGTTSKIKAAFIPVAGTQADMIGSALSYNGLTPNNVKRLGTGLWDDPRVAAQPNLQGGWFAAPSTTIRRDFEQKYTAAFGASPIRIASLAYDATALAAILAKNGFTSGNKPAFDYSSITNANGFAGTDGVFRFKQNGIVERGLAILEIRNGKLVEIDPAPTRF